MMKIVIVDDDRAAADALAQKLSTFDETQLLTSSLRTPKIFIKEFCNFLMPCHQHCLGVNLFVQR